jgi:hypothetical protein
MTRALLLGAALALAGCAAAPNTQVVACTSDAECGAGQLCFAEGCGDPGKGIVVELGGDPVGGLYARDVPIADGTLGKDRNFDLGSPLLVTGEFQREKSGNIDPTNRTFYNEPVVLRAIGQSELIPGISRVFEQRFDRPERGRYTMNVGAGKFRLTAWPVDPSVPPASSDNVAVEPMMNAPDVTFAFPAVEGAVTLSGRLIKRLDATQVPNVEIALTQTTMDLQAFDPSTKEALSQRFPVSSTAGSSQGDFTITLGPRAKELPAVLLVASPRDASSLPTPTKSFLIEAPFPNAVTLELGDFGDAVPLKGQVIDHAGQPVADAQVLLQGVVAGGGTYRSRVVMTDATGTWKVTTLVNAPDQALSLIVIPPPMSDSAVTRVAVKFDPVTGQLDKSTVTCDQRLTVSGLVVTPEGEPARNVGVRALEHVANIDSGAERPFPLDPVEVLTDDAGAFTLKLDPATWRFEFVSSDLPLASRLVTVRSQTDANGELVNQVALPTVSLAKGRTVSGVVTGTVSLTANAPVPYTTLRFFRVTAVEGRASAILLGSTVADDKGHYTVVLPSR